MKYPQPIDYYSTSFSNEAQVPQDAFDFGWSEAVKAVKALNPEPVRPFNVVEARSGEPIVAKLGSSDELFPCTFIGMTSGGEVVVEFPRRLPGGMLVDEINLGRVFMASQEAKQVDVAKYRELHAAASRLLTELEGMTLAVHANRARTALLNIVRKA